MTTDTIVPSAISAISGLVGVLLGGGLTFWREVRQEKIRNRKSGEYLAILVVAHLDMLVQHCLMVSLDDGTSRGQPSGSSGCHEITVDSPIFEPLNLNVEWKSLPANLMYEILNLPVRLSTLENHIAGIWEFDDGCEYTETFWARQHGYAVIGLEVSGLAIRLRRYANLPLPTHSKDELSRDSLLQGQRDKIEKERADYEERVRANHKIPPFIDPA